VEIWDPHAAGKAPPVDIILFNRFQMHTHYIAHRDGSVLLIVGFFDICFAAVDVTLDNHHVRVSLRTELLTDAELIAIACKLLAYKLIQYNHNVR
jgi:hypothetical protein